MVNVIASPFNLCIAMVCAFFISVTLTPLVRVLAFKFKVTDVPKDNRRMHKKEMPLMGGLAIYFSFVLCTLIFSELDMKIVGVLLGATLIVLTGIIDDKYNMKAIVKLLLQIAAGTITVLSGVKIEMINFFGTYLPFGEWSGVITVLWIVALTNAINLIDGLDGLSCGVSTISCFTLLFSLFNSDTEFSIIILIGILAGSCLGFLPFNFNPAKIFMGDTGALFLGYIMSVLSILGCFKLNALVSFWVPFLIFALPLLDTAFAFSRRILKGKSPFSADRGHVHHRLIDRGFDQKHSVLLLYAVSGISGVSAILISMDNYVGGVAMFIIAIVVLILNLTCGSDSNGLPNADTGNKDDNSTDALMNSDDKTDN